MTTVQGGGEGNWLRTIPHGWLCY